MAGLPDPVRLLKDNSSYGGKPYRRRRKLESQAIVRALWQFCHDERQKIIPAECLRGRDYRSILPPVLQTRDDLRLAFPGLPLKTRTNIHNLLNGLGYPTRVTWPEFKLLSRTLRPANISEEQFASVVFVLATPHASSALDHAAKLDTLDWRIPSRQFVDILARNYKQSHPDAGPIYPHQIRVLIDDQIHRQIQDGQLSKFDEDAATRMIMEIPGDRIISMYHEALRPMLRVDSIFDMTRPIEVPVDSRRSNSGQKARQRKQSKRRRKANLVQKQANKPTSKVNSLPISFDGNRRTPESSSYKHDTSCQTSPYDFWKLEQLNSPPQPQALGESAKWSGRSASPDSPPTVNEVPQTTPPNPFRRSARLKALASSSVKSPLERVPSEVLGNPTKRSPGQTAFDPAFKTEDQGPTQRATILLAPAVLVPPPTTNTIVSAPPIPILPSPPAISPLKFVSLRLSPENSHEITLVSTSTPDKISTPRKPNPTKSPYFPTPTSSRKRNRSTGTVSCLEFPSLAAAKFGLIQEQMASEPHKLLVAVQLLNRTTGRAALPIFFKLIEKYPTPKSLANADYDEVREMIQPLGLHNHRAKSLITMSKEWVENPPKGGVRYRTLNYPQKGDGKDVKIDETLEDQDPRTGAFEIAHLHGIGAYALDSWRIFCRDVCRDVADGYNGEWATTPTFEPEWKRVLPQDKELTAYLRWRWLQEGWEWNSLNGSKKRASDAVMDLARKGGLSFNDMPDGSVVIKASDDEDTEWGEARPRGDGFELPDQAFYSPNEATPPINRSLSMDRKGKRRIGEIENDLGTDWRVTSSKPSKGSLAFSSDDELPLPSQTPLSKCRLSRSGIPASRKSERLSAVSRSMMGRQPPSTPNHKRRRSQAGSSPAAPHNSRSSSSLPPMNDVPSPQLIWACGCLYHGHGIFDPTKRCATRVYIESPGSDKLGAKLTRCGSVNPLVPSRIHLVGPTTSNQVEGLSFSSDKDMFLAKLRSHRLPKDGPYEPGQDLDDGTSETDSPQQRRKRKRARISSSNPSTPFRRDAPTRTSTDAHGGWGIMKMLARFLPAFGA